jgi:hypothetical protein
MALATFARQLDAFEARLKGRSPKTTLKAFSSRTEISSVFQTKSLRDERAAYPNRGPGYLTDRRRCMPKRKMFYCYHISRKHFER